VRWWASGLNGQSAQLHDCVVATQRAHPGEEAAKMLGHLRAEVPACMETAGYVTTLDNPSCDRALWQGSVYCYAPRSRMNRWLFEIAAALANLL
jgi:hypothetical protein